MINLRPHRKKFSANDFLDISKLNYKNCFHIINDRVINKSIAIFQIMLGIEKLNCDRQYFLNKYI